MFLEKTINQLDNQLPHMEENLEQPSLLAMVGLPGSGKSSIVRTLSDRYACIVISTDDIRQRLLAKPTYMQEEVQQVYVICRALIERRLLRGQRVIFDASNYSMARRNRLRDLASKTQAVLTFCRVRADVQTIAQRLDKRMNGQRDNSDLSEAGWSVYQWMSAAEEPIQGDYLTLDTSLLRVDDAVQQLITYWQRMEARAQSKNHL